MQLFALTCSVFACGLGFWGLSKKRWIPASRTRRRRLKLAYKETDDEHRALLLKILATGTREFSIIQEMASTRKFERLGEARFFRLENVDYMTDLCTFRMTIEGWSFLEDAAQEKSAKPT